MEYKQQELFGILFGLLWENKEVCKKAYVCLSIGKLGGWLCFRRFSMRVYFDAPSRSVDESAYITNRVTTIRQAWFGAREKGCRRVVNLW